MIWTMGVAPDLGDQSHPWLDMTLNSHLFSFLKELFHPKIDILSSITQPIRPLFFFVLVFFFMNPEKLLSFHWKPKMLIVNTTIQAV